MIVLPALLLGIACISTACGDDKNEPESPQTTSRNISISPESAEISNEAQSVTFTVNSEGDWNISSNQDWARVSPNGGLKNQNTTVTVTVTANTATTSRQAEITVKTGTNTKSFSLTQNAPETFRILNPEKSLSGIAQEFDFSLESNVAWTASADASWITVKTKSGNPSDQKCTIAVSENKESSDRSGKVTFSYAGKSAEATVTQLTDAFENPEGYTLVWNDEFNDDNANIQDKWTYDVQGPGWVNNELQRYVAGSKDGKKVAEIHDGMLTITAQKNGNEVISGRLNSKQGWTYGIIEARLSLPKGKGTWPAFWMYPSNPNGSWPYCGEIDIMEEVGCVPNEVSSSIHCKAYNHPNNTQKTAARTLKNPGAEENFHIYRLEWTEDYIRTYVDGVQLFNFPNDKKGSRDTWPFDYDFKIILNLAWGGSWGGMYGVDESALPVYYHIDYVRVFQKVN